MKLVNETAKQLHELLEYIGLEPEAYSGRGMYGKECLSINIESYELGSVFFEMGVALAKNNSQEVPDALLSYSTDNMGYGIVVYWKSALVESETEEA